MGGYKVVIKDDVLRKLKTEALVCLEQTAEEIRKDLSQSQTIPFKAGYLSGDGMFCDYTQSDNGIVKIINGGPYARRLYYHPEYDFSKKYHTEAGALWLETYLNGEKKEFARKTFKKLYKSRTGV